MLAPELLADPIHLRRHLVERHAGLDPGERAEMPAAAACIAHRGVVADRRPELRRRKEPGRVERLERRRHHADDAILTIVHHDRASDDGRIRTKATTPK